MKFIKKIFLSLTFLFIGLNPNLYSMEEIGASAPIIEIPTESTGSWFGWMPKTPSMPELPSMPEMPTFSFRDTLNSAGSKLGSFFGYNGPFKFEHSGAEELALLNEQKSSVLNIGQELLKSAQTLESIGSEADVTSIQQASECFKPFAENLEQQRQHIFQNAQTILEESPKNQSWFGWLFGLNDDLPQLKTTYPLHDADGITSDQTRRYAVDLLELKQKGVSELEQCLGSVENQALIKPLTTEALQGQDEINAQASQLRFESLKYNFNEFVNQAWQIPAIKVALVAAGASLAPIILYKLYRAVIYPVRGFKGISHRALVKREIELLEAIAPLSVAPDGEEEEARVQREQNLAERNAELVANTNLKRSYEQYSYTTLATKPYLWALQRQWRGIKNICHKSLQGAKWSWENKKKVGTAIGVLGTAAVATTAPYYFNAQ